MLCLESSWSNKNQKTGKNNFKNFVCVVFFVTINFSIAKQIVNFFLLKKLQKNYVKSVFKHVCN